ncbi:MAG: ATP-dependent Clp protease ATP-binding subunit [Deltaproteobacteria bacterium]|nr:MAG: ATP-dependent Clp protease ATP-binding subunit [Deltaproteobacteria bacterium]
MIDLSSYRDRLSEKAQQILSYAIEESQKRQHYYLGVEHIFLALTEVEGTLFNETMEKLGLSPREVINCVRKQLNISRQYLGSAMKIPPDTKSLFQMAWERVQSSGRTVITSNDIFVAIFQDEQSLPAQILKTMGVEPKEAVQRIGIQVRRREEWEKQLRIKYDLPPYLRQFGVNLNKLAREDKLPPIIGREEEIDQMLEFLCHRERSNSVMILGEPGVGKTAIVEGLAQRLEFQPDSVPRRLRGRQIVNLQMNTIVAGTMFRGMFEDRLEKVIGELKERQNFIVFVDEAHSLVGAGSALGVPSDAANIFKSSLSRGEIQIIGATTEGEYKEYIAEDEALARRFRVITLREPTEEETRRILMGVKPRLESNYGVSISDEALETSLELSSRYNRALKLPDKCISWLDTAAVKVEIKRPDDTVKPSDIMEVISQESRVPLDMVFRDTTERFSQIEEALARRVVGQKEAITTLARQLRLNKGPLKEKFNRPDGVLLFLGPSGVGKTELAKALAEFLFGDEKKMVRLDMSEYRDSTIAVDKLIGMPRGIVGSERGGILTNLIRDNPYTVVLLDEIEKASSYVLNLFLQVFDEGWLTDGRGRKVYFSDAVIIMTSNLGSDEFRKFTKPLGFLEDSQGLEAVKRAVVKEVENNFSPEFINRIDDVIVFSPLSEDEVREITRMYLEEINEFLNKQGKALEISDRAIEALARTGFSLKYGARFLKRNIDDKIKIPITLQWKKGNLFAADIKEGEITVNSKSRRKRK